MALAALRLLTSIGGCLIQVFFTGLYATAIVPANRA